MKHTSKALLKFAAPILFGASSLFAQTALIGPDSFNNLDAWSFGDNGEGTSESDTFNSTNTPDYFGTGNSYLHVAPTVNSAQYLYQDTSTTGSFVASSVVTLSTNFYFESTTSPTDVTTMVMGINDGAGQAAADQAMHIRFISTSDSSVVRIANSDSNNFFTTSTDTVHNLYIVLNNSASTVNYGDTSVASLRADIYLDGTLMSDDVIVSNVTSTGYTGGATDLKEFEFRTFSAQSHANAINNYDNFVLYQGAVAIPEPGTYALLAGILGLAVTAWRRRKA